MTSRIQCTPDLQPTDVTGLAIFDQETREFEFRQGPIFANVVLVDEVNRAMPKTQSALLEAMAEQQVTVDGVTRALPDPFLLLATENPIEYEGTFPLPEAQLDRFFLRTALGYPVGGRGAADRATSSGTCTRSSQLGAGGHGRGDPRAAAPRSSDVYVDEVVRRWIVDLVRSTRELDARRDRRVGAGEPRARARRARLGAAAAVGAMSCRRTSSSCSCPSSRTGSCSSPASSPDARAAGGIDVIEELRRQCLELAPRPGPSGTTRCSVARVCCRASSSGARSRSSRAAG